MMPDDLHIGSRVVAHGLRSRADLNGQPGLVIAYLSARERYAVQFAPTIQRQAVLLKRSNVHATQDGPQDDLSECLNRCRIADHPTSSSAPLLPALHDDVIRLVALSCPYTGGLHWCSACKAFRAALPPLHTLYVDNGSDFQTVACPVRAGICPGPLHDDSEVMGDYDLWYQQKSVRVPRFAVSDYACQQVVRQRACGGFQFFVFMRGPYHAADGREWGRKSTASVHDYLQRMPSIFANSLERLSISAVDSLYPALEGLPPNPTHVATRPRTYGSRLIKLRVLEILMYATDYWCVGYRARAQEVDAYVDLVRATAPTLRSLAIVSGCGFAIEEVRQFLPDIGGRLHYLALFLGTCDINDYRGGRGILLQPTSAAMRAARERGDDRLYFRYGAEHDMDENAEITEIDGGLPDNLCADAEEEMETEMLRNMAEGLCVALLEPARVLAHFPGWGEAARRRCEAALPLAHWLQ